MGFKLHYCPRSRLARAARGGGRSPRAILTSPSLYMERPWQALQRAGQWKGRWKDLVVSSVHWVCWSLFQTQMQPPRAGRQAGTLDLLSSCGVGRGVPHHEAAGPCHMEDRVKVVKQLTVRWGCHLGHPVRPGSAQGSFDVQEEGRTVGQSQE